MRSKNFRRFWRRLPALVLGFGLVGAAGLTTGCTEDLVESNSLRPAWFQNQEFHIESRYQHVHMKTERGDAAADPAADDLGETMDLVDQWSDAVYWRYQVLRSNFRPEEGDDFYEYAVKGGTESTITVIKASLDPTLNLENELVEADPKIYMVVRDDRLRMAGLVVFYTVNGERISDAVTVDDNDMNRSFNLLSQTNLSIIPHFIPPFPIVPDDGEMTLEDGQLVTFNNATASGVDVVYENSMDDTLICDTWEDGQPWATFSITPTIESRLMGEDEVPPAAFGEGEDVEDFDFVDLLKQGVSLNDSVHVDEMIGTHTFSAREGFRPWAGSWWPQSSQALTFGAYGVDTDNDTSTLDTPSDTQREVFATPGKQIQDIGEELRTLRRNGQGESTEYTDKVQEYRDAQSALVDALVKFYNAIRQGIDGGQIVVEDGRLKADDDWHADYVGFDFDIDRLSPLDKFALVQQLENNTHGTNPWFGPAWELLNHWSPSGSAWFGHCNGWAAAAILTNEPREATTMAFGPGDAHEIEWSVADQKGLLSESYYSQLSNFYGARYNGDEGEDISDLSPKAVLKLLWTYMAERGVPLVFDTSANEEVWNFPAWEFELTMTETTPGGAGGGGGNSDLVNINTAGVDELTTLWGISTVRAGRVIAYREQNGPFQTTEEIIDVSGIGRGIFNRIEDQITVAVTDQLRTFEGNARVHFTTDGVGFSHVDGNINQPDSFWKDWRFTLEASPAGEIISGQWNDNENGHPDFAWVPYVNTVRSGRSENPYLNWLNLRDYLPDGTVRE